LVREGFTAIEVYETKTIAAALAIYGSEADELLTARDVKNF